MICKRTSLITTHVDSANNVIPLTSDYSHSEPAMYLVDTTSDVVTINVSHRCCHSFYVKDATKNFNVNSCIVNILDVDGEIEHVAELDKKDQSFYFCYCHDCWNYNQNGDGYTVPITSYHYASVDFPEL